MPDSSDGSFVKVFVDGRPQTLFGGIDDGKVPARLSDYGSHGYQLGFPWHSSRAADKRRSQKPFLIDEFKIWSAP